MYTNATENVDCSFTISLANPSVFSLQARFQITFLDFHMAETTDFLYLHDAEGTELFKYSGLNIPRPVYTAPLFSPFVRLRFVTSSATTNLSSWRLRWATGTFMFKEKEG